MNIAKLLTSKRLVKGLVLSGLSFGIMGNSSCDKQDPAPEQRMLRRRVQMGKINAPPIELPQSFGGKKFDFSYVANMQMYDILRRTQSFSTADVDPNQTWNSDGLDNSLKDDFNSCGYEEDQEAQVYSGLTGQKMAGSLASKTSMSQSAACLIDMPQARIEGDILDFQLTSGGGISVGLGSIKFLKALDFSFEKYQLDVTLRAKHPLEIGDHYFSTTLQKSFGKKMSVGATIDFGAISLGPKYYFQSPLSKVVDEGLTMAVTDLRNNWSKDDPWYAMVLRSCDKYLYINGGMGNDAGLKVGDIVAVKNVTYFWYGESCKSKLKGEMSLKPVAYAKIISVGRNISAAEIIERDPNYPHLPDRIYPGSRVYLEKMVEQVQADAAKTQQKLRKK